MERTNITRAEKVLEELARVGVEKVVLLAGARNAPLAHVLFNRGGFELIQLFEERSAAFFAIGNTKMSGRPTAVLTTSGTAAAELLPAAIEAHYEGLPLVLVTADRPAAYRGTGAPQCIDQVGIFGPYARVVDLEQGTVPSFQSWSGTGPIHLNIPFTEPLLDGDVSQSGPFVIENPRWDPMGEETKDSDVESYAQFLSQCKAPLVVAGELPFAARDVTVDTLFALGAPVYLEALSQLREAPGLSKIKIGSGERFVSEALRRGICDGVIRVGGIPTVRAWRDLDGEFAHVPVLSITHRPSFSGLRHDRKNHWVIPLRGLAALLSQDLSFPATEQIMEQDRLKRSELRECFSAYPSSEPALIRSLSAHFEEGSLVYLGNSMPIRQWDLAAAPDNPLGPVAGNRGANGIDGQVSTFLGMCREGRANVALLGDLTTLYDGVGFHGASKLSGEIQFTAFVINNGGGRIFGRIFEDERYQNPMDHSFEPVAANWSLEYEKWLEIPDVPRLDGKRLVEIRPDNRQTDDFYTAYWAIWSR